jgi:hypothetical protein
LDCSIIDVILLTNLIFLASKLEVVVCSTFPTMRKFSVSVNDSIIESYCYFRSLNLLPKFKSFWNRLRLQITITPCLQWGSTQNLTMIEILNDIWRQHCNWLHSFWPCNHGYFLITFRLLFIILTYFVLTETYMSLDI